MKKILLLIFLFISFSNIYSQKKYLCYYISINSTKNNLFKIKEITSFDNNKYLLDSTRLTQNNYGIYYRQNFFKSYFLKSNFSIYKNTISFKTIDSGDSIYKIKIKGFQITPTLGWYFYNRKVFKLFINIGFDLYINKNISQSKQITYGTGEYEFDEYGGSSEITKTDKTELFNQFDNYLFTTEKFKYKPTFEIGYCFEFGLSSGFSIKYEPFFHEIISNKNIYKDLKLCYQIGFRF